MSVLVLSTPALSTSTRRRSTCTEYTHLEYVSDCDRLTDCVYWHDCDCDLYCDLYTMSLSAMMGYTAEGSCGVSDRKRVLQKLAQQLLRNIQLLPRLGTFMRQHGSLSPMKLKFFQWNVSYLKAIPDLKHVYDAVVYYLLTSILILPLPRPRCQ